MHTGIQGKVFTVAKGLSLLERPELHGDHGAHNMCLLPNWLSVVQTYTLIFIKYTQSTMWVIYTIHDVHSVCDSNPCCSFPTVTSGSTMRKTALCVWSSLTLLAIHWRSACTDAKSSFRPAGNKSLYFQIHGSCIVVFSFYLFIFLLYFFYIYCCSS